VEVLIIIALCGTRILTLPPAEDRRKDEALQAR
jgi:hypothetical protein